MHTRTRNYDFGRELRLQKYITSDTKRIAYNQSSKYLTLASIEVISIFIEDESNQVTKKEIGKAKKEIDKKELDMKGKVTEVAELLRTYNLTSDHNSEWNRQENENEPFDIFNYKYNMIKVNSLKQVVLSQKINFLENYQSISEEMEQFFERTQNQLRDMIESEELLSNTADFSEAIAAESVVAVDVGGDADPTDIAVGATEDKDAENISVAAK